MGLKIYQPITIMIHTHYLMCTKVSFCLKSSRNKKDLNDVTAAPVSSSQLPAAKKHTKNGAAVTSLRSFLFRDDFICYIVLIELTSNLVIIKRTLSAILECCLRVIRKSSSKAGSLAASFISKVFLLRTFHGRIHDSF